MDCFQGRFPFRSLVLSFVIYTLRVCKCSGEDPAPTERVVPEDEFCEGKTFEPRCAENEILVINSAYYGRMKYGKCVTSGKTGCSLNVLDILDERCSGKPRCTVDVVDVFQSIPEPQRPCPFELRGYLTVSYMCVVVHLPITSDCNLDLGNTASAPRRGYISSHVIRNNPQDQPSCGSMEHPLFIQLGPFQTIRVTLLDFAATRALASGSCTVYAVLKIDEDRPLTVCESTERQSAVAMATGSEMELRLTAKNSNRMADYILMFEVTGCDRPVAPRNGWTRVLANDRAEMGCNKTGRHWLITCNGSDWIAAIKDCSSPNPGVIAQSKDDPESFFGIIVGSQWVVIGAVLAIAFVVAAMIVIAGVAYLKRRGRRRSLQEFTQTYDRREESFLVNSVLKTDRFGNTHFATCPKDSSDYFASFPQRPQNRTIESFYSAGTPPGDASESVHGPRQSWGSSGRSYHEHIYETPHFATMVTDGQCVYDTSGISLPQRDHNIQSKVAL